MRQIPVDQAQLEMLAVQVSPKLRRENGVETQKTTADGVPQWAVSVLLAGGDPELLNVTVAGAQAPQIAAMTPVRFEKLVATPWDFNGKSGTAFGADSVQALRGKGAEA